MSDAASTEDGTPLSPVARDAARGILPRWARVSDARRAHMARVAALLGEWADELGLAERERERWMAVGWLHDALREAEPERLREQVPHEMRDLSGPVLHGPAAAERLSGDLDAAALDAIRYHTIGHPGLDRLGRALYLADFLEPGREFLPEWRAGLRARMPDDMDAVLIEVLSSRLRHLVDGRRPLRPETARFWSALVGGRR